MSSAEKKLIFRAFYEASASESALLWGKTAQLDFTDIQNAEVLIHTFFKANMWIQAFCFINGLDPSQDSTLQSIVLFIHLMEAKHNSQYLPYIPFNQQLNEIYLSELSKYLPQSYVFALIFRQRYGDLLNVSVYDPDIAKLVSYFKELSKGINYMSISGNEISVQLSVIKVTKKSEGLESDSEFMQIAAPHPENNLSITASSIRPTKLSFTPRYS